MLSSKLRLRAEAVAAPGDPGHRRADERAASPTAWAATGQAGGWTTPPPDPDAIAADVGRAVNDRPVETDGAARAAPHRRTRLRGSRWRPTSASGGPLL